jgi:alpha 1,2-mannosyltransferase
MEATFNWKYNYPWIFLNEEPFTEEFMNLTRSMTKAEVRFGLVPKEHWGYPDWINQTHASEQRNAMARKGIIYGESESYRHMCR